MLAHTRLILALCLALGATAHAYDYPVRPVPPRLERDGQTTFLVDFTQRKPLASFAAGNRQIAAEHGALLRPEGLKGPVTIAAARNLDPTAYTLELVLQVPSGLSAQDEIASWEVANNYRTSLSVDALTVHGRRGQAGRMGEFRVRATMSGNGWSVSEHGAEQTVYLAVGLDLAGQRAAAVARTLDGHLLSRTLHTSWQGGPALDRALPENERAAAAESWRQMLAAVRAAAERGEPGMIRLGHPQVSIARMRISRGFREELLVPQPEWPTAGAGGFAAGDLDPKRAVTHTVTRDLGYPGYRNFRPVTIQESYIPLKAGDAPISIKLPAVPIGIYSLMVHGMIDPQGRDKLERVWKPCPMAFELRDGAGNVVEQGRLLLKQSFSPRRVQGFHLHVNTPGDYTATLRLTERAQETARIVYVRLVDHLDGLPDEAIKRQQTLTQSNGKRLASLTPERQQRDDDIWRALPPLNVHLQVHAQVAPFRNPPGSGSFTPWVLASSGTWANDTFKALQSQSAAGNAFKPLDFINTQTGQVLPHDKVVAGAPFPAAPGEPSDDGTGIYLTRQQYPQLPHDIYYAPRAVALGQRVHYYLGFLGVWDHGKRMSLPARYAEKGDASIGHDAALALVRLAYDWPALEMNLHEIRLSTHSPDFEFNRDWSGSRNGKYFYEGWSGQGAVDLLTAYDQLFPYIQDNQVFADAVGRFIPWVKTPRDVVRFLDRWLVWASVRDFRRGRVRAAPVEDVAARVLGPHPLTAELYDLTQQYAEIYPYKGTYQEIYATALSRSGSYHIGSFMVYALGSAADTVQKAALLRAAREQGVKLPMDLSDVERYPKVRGAANFLLDMWVAGGFPFMVGDASGGPHTGHEAWKRLAVLKSAIEDAFLLTGDPRHAFVLQKLGSTDPAVTEAASGGPAVRDPILHAPSRVVPDWGAILEMDPDETDITRKTAATLRLGTAQGHAHSDYLDLNFFAMGLPLAVDLACRNEGNNWSRPGAAWALLHNHAIAHASEDPSRAGGQSGEPWLRAFAPPVVRASYVNQNGQEQLDREVVMMRVGESDTYYAFDLQRLRGNKLHTWCFHGCESDGLELNVPMEDKTVRWIDRTLPPHRVGAASDALQAVWTMTRESGTHRHEFSGGGEIKTVAAEPHVLRERYDESLPPVRVRATLLGHAGAQVVQGSPYSQAYSYAFPFLWVQASAPEGGESVYPAIYEWYRGDQPVVAKAEILSKQPWTVRVTTISGQVDTFSDGPGGLSVVSRDAQGVRWAKLVDGTELKTDGLSIQAARPRYQATITDIDYVKRTLTLSDALPNDPYIIVGNPGRTTFLQLKGSGTSFTFEDDLLVQEGPLTDVAVKDGAITFKTTPAVFRGNEGNRKLDALAQTTEDGQWHFRAGKPIRSPAGATLNEEVFTDANGDGRVHVKTYEIGIGDTATLPADIEARRVNGKLEIQTNVPVTVNGRQVQAGRDWR